MNGRQIEELSLLIDRNMDMLDTEAANYIETHLVELAEELHAEGTATVMTNAGPLLLSMEDLEITAA